MSSFLCFANQENINIGEICTNRCPLRQECNIEKVSFLIEAADRLTSEAFSEEIKGLDVITFKTDCISPEAYINGAIDE